MKKHCRKKAPLWEKAPQFKFTAKIVKIKGSFRNNKVLVLQVS